MSYEGYSQFWCKNGHYWTIDCMALPDLQYMDPVKQKCPVCGAEEVRENMVNTTNGSYEDGSDERIDGYIELELAEAHKTTCGWCDKQHVCKCSIYKIPEYKIKTSEEEEGEE